MKIFQVNASYGRGSTGSICEEIKKYLESLGHECVVYYGNYSSDRAAIRMTSSFGVKCHSLLARLFGLGGYYSSAPTRRLIADIRRERPDAVHLHNLHGNYINVPMLLRALKSMHVRTVITLHDCWFFTGKCTHYTAAGCNGWLHECGRCPLLRAEIPSYIFDRTKKMLRDKRDIYDGFNELAVVAVSDWIYWEAKRSILAKNDIVRIYNWIDTEVFYPRNVEKHDGFNILCVSAEWASDMTKYQDLIRLAELVGDECKIMMVGRVAEGLIPPANVHVIPFVSDKNEMARIYSSADVYVHLSREDSFGKVITEALACGTPSIVYDSTACPELIGDGCGYSVPVGDVDAVCAAIEEIRANSKSVYSDKCVEFVRQFDKESLLEQTVALYEKK